VLKLHPFQAEPWLTGIELSSALQWNQGILELRYRLRCREDQLTLPPPSNQRERRDELWMSSCFEAFIGVRGEKNYWEINLASSGDWNVYRLNDYRDGLAQEPAVQQLNIQQERQHQGGDLQLDLAVEIPMAPLIPAGTAIEASITAVLDGGASGISYWALEHTGSEADFHRRDSFCLRA
jgi:hypothetical protein